MSTFSLARDEAELKSRRRRANRQLFTVLGSVMLMVLAIAWLSRVQPPDPVLPDAPVVAERTLTFEAAEDGVLRVVDASTGDVLRVIPRDEETFIRGALRVVGRERTVHRVDPGAPLQLSLHEGGAVILRDVDSEVVYDLRAFGQTNVEAFMQFLDLPANDDLAAGGGRETDNL